METRSLVRRAAAIGLPGLDGTEAPLDVPQELWPHLRRHLVTQRLTGIAVGGITTERLRLHPDGREELFEDHRRAMVLVLALERKLLQVVSEVERAGVGVVLLKGPALAHSYYPSPAWRSYGDLDLLVRARDWRVACAVVSELGFHRLIPEPRPGFDERFGKGASHEDGEGFQVDLHRTLTLGPFGLWLQPDELFERTLEMEIGGRKLQRLDDASSLLHVCIHASLGRKKPLLMPLRDVLQVAWSGRVDWAQLRSDARRWRLNGPVGHALRTAAVTLGVELPDEATPSTSAKVGYLERRALAAYTTERRDMGGTVVTSLLAIRGVRGKSAYVRALVFPDRGFLAHRLGKRASYRLRWRIPLSWIRRRFGRDKPGATG